MSRKTIAFDIDDVLAANAEGFAAFSNERWGTNLKPGDYSEHWAEIWGINQEEADERREVVLTEKLFTSYRFFDEAMAVLKKLRKNYNLVVVTSRANRVQKDTLDWVKKEYGDIFLEIHFAKIWNDSGMPVSEKLKMTKAELCREIGADYLVDDQPKHCLAAAEAGIVAVLFGDYDWNRNIKLVKNMVRATDWPAVLEYFEGQKEAK
jgi:uncharacterized HAD superfamily protein